MSRRAVGNRIRRQCRLRKDEMAGLPASRARTFLSTESERKRPADCPSLTANNESVTVLPGNAGRNLWRIFGLIESAERMFCRATGTQRRKIYVILWESARRCSGRSRCSVYGSCAGRRRSGSGHNAQAAKLVVRRAGQRDLDEQGRRSLHGGEPRNKGRRLQSSVRRIRRPDAARNQFRRAAGRHPPDQSQYGGLPAQRSAHADRRLPGPVRHRRNDVHPGAVRIADRHGRQVIRRHPHGRELHPVLQQGSPRGSGLLGISRNDRGIHGNGQGPDRSACELRLRRDGQAGQLRRNLHGRGPVGNRLGRPFLGGRQAHDRRSSQRGCRRRIQGALRRGRDAEGCRQIHLPPDVVAGKSRRPVRRIVDDGLCPRGKSGYRSQTRDRPDAVAGKAHRVRIPDLVHSARREESGGVVQAH